MPEIIINEFHGDGPTATGHVNMSFVLSDGSIETYGRNMDEYGDGGVYIEVAHDGQATEHHSIIVSQAQFDDMRAYAQQMQIADDYYFVFGHNCVDFVEELLAVGGLNTSVQTYIGYDQPVGIYAGLSDFVDYYYGGDDILVDSIREVAGQVLEQAVIEFGSAVTSVENTFFKVTLDDFASGISDAYDRWYAQLQAWG